jgi:hypothetical protein
MRLSDVLKQAGDLSGKVIVSCSSTVPTTARRRRSRRAGVREIGRQRRKTVGMNRAQADF